MARQGVLEDIVRIVAALWYRTGELVVDPQTSASPQWEGSRSALPPRSMAFSSCLAYERV